MTYGECPFANETCKYYDRSPVRGGNRENGCYSDKDHKVPQRLATTALAKAFIYSPENMQQICRDEHDAKTMAGDEPLPDRETMVESVLRQTRLGRLIISRELKNKIIGGTL